MEYNVIVTVDTTARDEATTDRILDALEDYAPAISWDDSGRMVVTVTYDWPSLVAATSIMPSEVRDATGAQVVHVEAMTTAEFDARAEVPA